MNGPSFKPIIINENKKRTKTFNVFSLFTYNKKTLYISFVSPFCIT